MMIALWIEASDDCDHPYKQSQLFVHLKIFQPSSLWDNWDKCTCNNFLDFHFPSLVFAHISSNCIHHQIFYSPSADDSFRILIGTHCCFDCCWFEEIQSQGHGSSVVVLVVVPVKKSKFKTKKYTPKKKKKPEKIQFMLHTVLTVMAEDWNMVELGLNDWVWKEKSGKFLSSCLTPCWLFPEFVFQLKAWDGNDPVVGDGKTCIHKPKYAIEVNKSSQASIRHTQNNE